MLRSDKKSSHDYDSFARSYAGLGLENTFYLAYRDLPELLKRHVISTSALDHGCGAGRSTRFLKQLGFQTIGADISEAMISEAQSRDPQGTYVKIARGDLPFDSGRFDLVFQSIVLLEYGSRDEIIAILGEFRRVLKDSGTVVVITDSPESYSNDSASFIRSFPQNKNLGSGQQALTQVRGTEITFLDYLWTLGDCREFFDRAGFLVTEHLRPLATGDEPYEWYSETDSPWWDIYVLKKI